jgi:hypothetical protein
MGGERIFNMGNILKKYVATRGMIISIYFTSVGLLQMGPSKHFLNEMMMIGK